MFLKAVTVYHWSLYASFYWYHTLDPFPPTDIVILLIAFPSLDIVPPKVLVKDFLESMKKKSKKASIQVDSSSSDSES